MLEMKFKCTICKNEMVHFYNPEQPKHIRKFTCDRCEAKFQRTVPRTEPKPASKEGGKGMSLKTKHKSTNKSKGYSRRKHESRFEIKQKEDRIWIHEYRAYEGSGDAEWYGGVCIDPAFLGSFIDALKSKNPQAPVSHHTTLSFKFSGDIVTISDDKMSYYKVFKVRVNFNKLVQELEKVYRNGYIETTNLVFLSRED